MSRKKNGRFATGAPKPANSGRKRGTPNKATRAWRDFVGELVTDPDNQDTLARAIAERPELLFKAAEHAVGKPRQSLEVTSGGSWTWAPPARSDGPISVPDGVLVFPQGSHIHEGGEEEHHCHLCHENWAARVDETNDCPRCALPRSGPT
jgi:hypothetical protein